MSDASEMEEFVRLLTENQRRMYVYVLSLVGNSADADEIVQNANLVLWRKHADYVAGTNFGAWAQKIAYFEVLAFRKRRQRDQLRFEPELIELLAEDAASQADAFERKRLALAACMDRLSARDLELIKHRYGVADATAVGSVSDLADQVGRTVHATYQALHRIRSSLLECMRRRLALEEA